MKNHLPLFVFLLLMTFTSAAQNCPEIIGYYPNWQWYDRAHLVNPFSIQYSKYSILNYAFFKPEANGSISSTDTWADENLLLGQINWSTTPVSYYPNTSIIDRAHNAGTKVLPSIGGWTLSNNFSSIAGSPAKRTLFAHSCNDLIRTYQFDGIDIDWEYPGYVPNAGTAADKANYTIFLQQIRDSLTALGLVNNKTYLLTTCVGASRANMLNVEWTNVANIVDVINLMTYDFFGPWDATANHNAPLYAPAQGDPTFNLDSAVSYLLNHYLLPPAKLAAGVAFYGRAAKTSGVPALFAPITGADNNTFSDDDGSPLYYNILNKQNLFTKYRDNTARVPYLLGNGALHTFVSFDDTLSIAQKATYIKNLNLRGLIIWEITGDYIESAPGSGIVAATPLIDTIRSVFCTNQNTNPVVNITPPGNLALCSGASLTLTATPGFASYLWSTGATTQAITVSSPGTYSLTATNSSNVTVGSNIVTVTATPCAAPAGLTAFNILTTQAMLRWSSVVCAQRYMLRYKPMGATTWTYSMPLTDTAFLLTTLLPGTSYTVDVQTWCDVSGTLQSTYSPTYSFTTLTTLPNQLPQVSIQAPATNSFFNSGSVVNVSVNASDADGSIQSVKLYLNNTLFGIDVLSPYAFTLNSLASGTYTLTARAFDNMNDSATSVAVVFTVLAAGTCNYPAWNATAVYNTNDTVSYNNVLYRAKWWSQNNVPSANYGNCCVWQYLMPCGGFTAATCYRPVYDSLVAYNANEEVYLNGIVYRANWWTLNENPQMHNGPGNVWTVNTAANCTIVLPLRVYLEGYYTGSGLMRPVLYNQGMESNPASMNTDTVRVELHGTVPPYALLHSATAILSTSGMLNVPFPSSVYGNSYYVVLKHRHVIETWSATPVLMNQSVYDFTNAAGKAYGGKQQQVGANVYALYSGDLNSDGNIDLIDASMLEYDVNQFLFGYYATDLNGDGNVDLLDSPLLEANINNFVFSSHP